MKALEIARKIDEYVREYGCANGTISLLDDLIDELEALESRSCSNCKEWHSKKIDHPNWRECNQKDNPYLYADTHYDFGCNRWESR